MVGISSAGIAGSDNLVFAISINGAREIIAKLIASGGLERGFLGIVSATITPGIARHFELPVSDGVYVDRVTAGSVAAAAGDIIVGLAGEPVDDQGDLGRALARNKPGSEVEVRYVRGEEAGERTATVVLGTRPAEE